MIKKIKIGNRIISNSHKPLVIAEISANHQNSLKKTFELLKKAADSKVEVVKFQTFNLNDMTINSHKNDFMIKNKFTIKVGIQDLYIAYIKRLIYHLSGIKRFLIKQGH